MAAATRLRTENPASSPLTFVWFVFVILLVVAGILAFWYLTVPYSF